MCQALLISDNIVRLGTRSYRQRIEAMGARGNISAQLNRLNRDLDKFYELLYSEWHTITAGDYKVFGPQLKIMLHTLKDLHTTYCKMQKHLGLSEEVEQLGMNYSALYEMNSDIVNFKVKAQHDKEMQQLLQRASGVIKAVKAG